MRYFISADYHFNHSNIIRYCGRPFKTIEENNREIIKRHNERVKDSDVVIFNGDYCFYKSGLEKAKHFQEQMNGQFIYIKGNHDKGNTLNTKIMNLTLHMGGLDIFITHRPEDYNMDYPINLVAHVHEKWKFRKTYGGVYLVNVGVDVWNFYPVTVNEILGKLEKWEREENKKEES